VILTRDKVITIFIDAFSSNYLDDEACPNIRKLSDDGFYSNIEPMFAFEGIGAALFTGAWPNTTKVWAEYILRQGNKKENALLSLLMRLTDLIPNDRFCWDARLVINKILGRRYLGTPAVIPAKLLMNFETKLTRGFTNKGCLGGVKTIFDVLRENDMTYTYYPPGRSDSRSVNSVVKAIRRRNLSEFTFLHLFSLDVMGHKYGPSSALVKRALTRIDDHIGEITHASETAGNVELIVFSDHGMSPVDMRHDAWNLLPNIPAELGKDYVVFLDSTMARFWFVEEKARRPISEAFSSCSWGRFLDYDDLRRFHIDKLGSEHGELIFALNDRSVLFPDFFRRREPPRGMHGYAVPTYDKPVLIISSEKRKFGGSQPRFIDMMPTILRMLQLRVPQTCEGRSIP